MKKTKKITISIISIIAIFLIVLLTFTNMVNAVETVQFSFLPDPYIDIVLSKGKTNTDVTNFKQDILNALKQQGVNINRVEVSSVETVYNQLSSEDVNVDEIINNWQVVGADTWRAQNGEIFSSTGGGQTKPAWWGTALIDPDGYESTEYSCDFTMVTGGELNEGICFNVTQNSDGSLNGYFIAICNHVDLECRLFKFNHYTLDQSFSSGINKIMWCGPHQNGWNVGSTYTSGADSYQVLAGWNIGVSSNVKYHVEYNNGHIIVKANNKTVADVYDNTYTKGTYGFWGNNCEMSTYMYLTDIKISTAKESTKKFTEVLREPEWRDGAIKVLVAVEDPENEELTQSTTLGELLTRLLNENIYFTTWGTNNNKSQFESLIHSNNDNGIFIDNTNYNNSINQTAIYIKSLLDNIEQSDNYLILGDRVSINMTPPEVANNTADETYPYGKWKIEHDYDYFENHIGQFAQSGKYIDDFITEFDKTGKYTITYADGTIMPSEVYVHRRPTAILKSVKTGTSISIISNSSDLDSYSQGENGIAQEEWKYKKTTENNWTTGKLTTLDTTSDYVVQLRVKDFQGIWSYPVSIYATNRTDAIPIASFGITNREITRYQTLEIIDTSYDPYGGEITYWNWELYKDNSKIYSGSTIPTKNMYDTVGRYTLSLTVKNNRNLTSETYSRTFEVIEDNIAPSVIIEPLNCNWTQSVDVKLEFYDDGGSGFKNYQYAITESQEIPQSYSSPITKQNDTITINEDGVKYLHIIATDNAGNTSTDRIAGPYNIDRTAPSITVNPEGSTWTQEVLVNLTFGDNGSGFKQYKYAITDSVENPSTWSEYITKATDTITINTEGVKYLHVIAEDNIGNISEEKVTGPYYIDRTAPSITVNPEGSTWTQEVLVNLTFGDNGSGFKQYKYAITDSVENPSTWSEYITKATDTITINTEGVKYLHVIAEDNIGNISEEKVTGPYYIDRTAPSITVNPEGSTWTQEVLVNLTFGDNGSGFKQYKYAITDSVENPSTWSEYITKATDTITINTEGVKYLHVIAEDNIGNISEEKVTGPYYIDRTAPSITVNPEGSTWTQEVLVNLTFGDNGSGFKQYKYAITDSVENPSTWSEYITKATDTITINTEGVKYLHVIAEDNIGNISEEKVTGPYYIDRTAPSITVNPEGSTWTQEVLVNLTFGDNGSGFKQYKYAITDSVENPSTWSEYITKATDTITINTEGVKYLHVIAEDNIGNISQEKVTGPYYIDRTPPTGTIDYNPKEWVMDELTLTWNFADSGSGFAKVILPDGQTESDNTQGTYKIYENGTYDFEVYDKLGNHQIISTNISNIDNIDPIIALSQRPSEWTDSDTIITWQCEDGQSGFREVLLPDGTKNTSATGEFIAEQVGTYTFIAYDNVGNKKTISIEIQNIDKIKPTIKLTQNTTEWVNEDVIITWECEDGQSGFKEILLPDGSTLKEKRGQVTAIANGIYTFVGYDNVGNTTIEKIEIKNIDKIEPTVKLKAEQIGEEYFVNWAIEDNESGVKEMLLPDGTTIKESSGQFPIIANGVYTFVGYDNAGNITIQSININIK